MRHWFVGTFAVVLAVVPAVGQVSSPAAAGQPQTAPSAASKGAAKKHGTFTVELVKSLDSKKLKEGDPVEAKLTGGITLPNGATVPRGAKVLGHVIEAKARSKSDSESSLGISFEKIAWQGGEDMPIHGVIQAVAPNPNEEITTGDYIGYGGLNETTEKPAKPDTRRGPVPILNDNSQGVLGIKNLQLGPDSVLTSPGKEVKLDSGTRMLLNVTLQ
jgi:hypothetical protein